MLLITLAMVLVPVQIYLLAVKVRRKLGMAITGDISKKKKEN